MIPSICLRIKCCLKIFLFICLSIHAKERIMDDFNPTNPATLSGHLKALELLGQLTARAGPARRYVRAHETFLSVSLPVLTHTHSHTLLHSRTYTHTHYTHTHIHTYTSSVPHLPQPSFLLVPLQQSIKLTSLQYSGRL